MRAGGQTRSGNGSSLGQCPKHGSGSDYGLSSKPPDQFRVEHVLRVLLARCHARAKVFRSAERTIRTYKFRPIARAQTERLCENTPPSAAPPKESPSPIARLIFPAQLIKN